MTTRRVFIISLVKKACWALKGLNIFAGSLFLTLKKTDCWWVELSFSCKFEADDSGAALGAVTFWTFRAKGHWTAFLNILSWTW